MTTSPRRRIATVLPLVLAPLLLAGCAAPAGGHPSTSARPADGASSAATSSTSAAGSTDLCALVSVAQAAAALDTTPAVTKQVTGVYENTGDPMCSYESGDTSVRVDVIYGPASHLPIRVGTGTVGYGPTTGTTVLGHTAASDFHETDVQLGDHTLVADAGEDSFTDQKGVAALATLFAGRL